MSAFYIYMKIVPINGIKDVDFNSADDGHPPLIQVELKSNV